MQIDGIVKTYQSLLLNGGASDRSKHSVAIIRNLNSRPVKSFAQVAHVSRPLLYRERLNLSHCTRLPTLVASRSGMESRKVSLSVWQEAFI
jgi:hypothetical protein